MTEKIQCKKCGRQVLKIKKAMWEHAIRFHTEMVFQTLAEKMANNNDGPDGLFSIGHGLGKELQSSGVGLIDVIKNIGGNRVFFRKGLK